MKAVSPSGMSDADLLDDLMGEVADSAADCFIAFLRDQPPTMSDENTDHVLDKHIMGEVVMSESTFPAAPLVRPPVLIYPVMFPPVLSHTTMELTAETLPRHTDHGGEPASDSTWYA